MTISDSANSPTDSSELEFQKWQSRLEINYNILRKVVGEELPDAWKGLEFVLSVLRILNIKNCTLPLAGIILGRASSSKTVAIELLRRRGSAFYTDNFSPKSFVSH